LVVNVTPVTLGGLPECGLTSLLTPVNGKRTSTVSKSALAITDEHSDLADAATGQLTRLSTRAAARATL
jgi:hypothetical protein